MPDQVHTTNAFIVEIPPRIARHASSRIVTGSAVQIREADNLTISNSVFRPVASAAQGTFVVKVKSNWTTAQWVDAPSQTLGVVEITGFSNPFRLLYSTNTGGFWGFRFRCHGTNVDAAEHDFATIGQENVVVCRWTGPNAELDLPANSIDIFIDGVEGEPSQTGSATTHTDDGLLRVGNVNLTDHVHWDGWISQLEFLPYVLTDDEIKALP